MNRKFLFSICLILVAIIGFGCVSAADVHNDTITDKPAFNVEQQNTGQIQDQNELINTEKIVKEDINSEINNGTDNFNSSQLEDKNYTKETSESINNNNSTINNNNSSIEPQETELQSNEDEDEEIEPGNGYSVEQIKKIRGYVQFYKEHNYSLRDLVQKVFKDEFPVNYFKNRDTIHEIMKAITVIHNSAMIQRGYGPLYNTDEVMRLASYYFFENVSKMLPH